MKTRNIVRFGKNSLAVIIPADMVRYWGWCKGDQEKVYINSQGLQVVALPRDEQEGGVDHGNATDE